jgi:hypothetical protein
MTMGLRHDTIQIWELEIRTDISFMLYVTVPLTRRKTHPKNGCYLKGEFYRKFDVTWRLWTNILCNSGMCCFRLGIVKYGIWRNCFSSTFYYFHFFVRRYSWVIWRSYRNRISRNSDSGKEASITKEVQDIIFLFYLTLPSTIWGNFYIWQDLWEVHEITYDAPETHVILNDSILRNDMEIEGLIFAVIVTQLYEISQRWPKQFYFYIGRSLRDVRRSYGNKDFHTTKTWSNSGQEALITK